MLQGLGEVGNCQNCEHTAMIVRTGRDVLRMVAMMCSYGVPLRVAQAHLSRVRRGYDPRSEPVLASFRKRQYLGAWARDRIIIGGKQEGVG